MVSATATLVWAAVSNALVVATTTLPPRTVVDVTMGTKMPVWVIADGIDSGKGAVVAVD